MTRISVRAESGAAALTGGFLFSVFRFYVVQIDGFKPFGVRAGERYMLTNKQHLATVISKKPHIMGAFTMLT